MEFLFIAYLLLAGFEKKELKTSHNTSEESILGIESIDFKTRNWNEETREFGKK